MFQSSQASCDVSELTSELRCFRAHGELEENLSSRSSRLVGLEDELERVETLLTTSARGAAGGGGEARRPAAVSYKVANHSVLIEHLIYAPIVSLAYVCVGCKHVTSWFALTARGPCRWSGESPGGAHQAAGRRAGQSRLREAGAGGRAQQVRVVEKRIHILLYDSCVSLGQL